MKKIALILPYFGVLPEWFNLFLHSCGKNKIIDFIFFTDCDIESYINSLQPQNGIRNVKIHKMSFQEYCSLVSQKLGIIFEPESPYKLCDLKPWYGAIHENILKDYHYWGYGDIDLVFGNLSKFLSEFVRKEKSVFSTHPDRISGHFCLFKNNDLYRTLPFKISNWQSILTDKKHYGVDEAHFSSLVLKRQRYFRSAVFRMTRDYWLRQKVLSILNRIIYRKIQACELFTSPRPTSGEQWIYVTKTGELKCQSTGRILPYLHFLFFKKSKWWKENEDYWKPGFYKINELDSTMEIIITKFEISKAI